MRKHELRRNPDKKRAGYEQCLKFYAVVAAPSNVYWSC